MKPNNFPLITPVANTELYTQTNDVNGKFTMNSAKEFITSPEDITYSELYNRVANEELIPGSWYRLTDYKSVNFLNGWEIANNNPTPTDPNFNPQEIYEGETEVLLLQAISSYQISEIGYSETFQGDIVQYQPYTNKIGVDIGGISNGSTLPDSSTVSGFDLQWDGTNVYFNMPAGFPALYGHYFYLYAEFNDGVDSYYQDGNFEPLTPVIANCQYAYTSDDPSLYGGKKMSRIKVVDNGMKVILLDLVEADYNNYVADTLYVDHIYALGDAYGWITKRVDTLRDITAPLDFRGRKYRRFEVEILGKITGISYTTPSNPLMDGIYNVYDTSGHSPNAGFTVTVSGNIITNVSIYISAGGYSIGDTINILGTDIGGTSPADDIVITVTSAPSLFGYFGQGDNFANHGTTGNFKDFKVFREDGYDVFNIEWNDMGGADVYWYCGYNDNNVFLGGIDTSKIGNYFQNNTIENNFYYNTIGNSFYSNTIGNNFYYNTIGNTFQSNTIGNNFYYNNIGDIFQSNTIGNEFQNNNIGDIFQSNTIGNNFYYNNIKGIFQSNTIGNEFQNNTIGNYFQSNTIGDYFDSNRINSYFFTNTIGSDFKNNIIGYRFYFNTIDNSFTRNFIGDYFYQNNIGGSFILNTTDTNFRQNIIGNDFNRNIISTFFQSNTINNNFQSNTVKYDVGSTNFSLATHVYGTYNCEIFRRSDNTLQLSYIDGTNTIQYAAITA